MIGVGDIVNGEMQLSKTGKLAYDFWWEIPEYYPFVLLDFYVVMPNHVHGIIVIDKPDDGGNDIKNDKQDTGQNNERHIAPNAETSNAETLKLGVSAEII